MYKTKDHDVQNDCTVSVSRRAKNLTDSDLRDMTLKTITIRSPGER